ncbi:SdpI family protein [Enterococcus asini]|uniref:SdpI family protein n=1 Tax=Enterococcus asini TaxID=57732 RepID=UPI0028918C84|nr:SdpI family protein [Enterococcus asini]MDT2757198.1 SdpI family protein [Enterococcus asini]
MISFFNALTFLWIAKTPPEKKINNRFGFQTKKAKTSQVNWDKAQLEMIRFAQKVVLPSCIIGLFFLAAEIYFILHWSENLFSTILLIEVLVPVISYFKMYYYVEKKLTD